MRLKTTFFLLLILAFLLIPKSSTAEEPKTTLILVRHAEKVLNFSTDPDLTPEGKARAEELAYALGLMDIQAVYSTPYRRTRLTALPTAEAQGIPVQEYNPGNEKKFIQEIAARHKGRNVLIVGHSNTIPRLANAAAGNDRFDDLPDSVYDNLFFVTIEAEGPASVIRLRFGKRTPGEG